MVIQSVFKYGFHNANNLEYSYNDPRGRGNITFQLYLPDNDGTPLQLGKLVSMPFSKLPNRTMSGVDI